MPYSYFSRHRLRTPSSARSGPAQYRWHKTVRSMMGFSWFSTRSSIQVQDWPVHQASFTKQIADRHSRPLHSRLRLPPVVSHPAEGRQTSCSPFPAFPSALAHFSRSQKADPACPGPVSLPAESPLPFLRSLASKTRLPFCTSPKTELLPEVSVRCPQAPPLYEADKLLPLVLLPLFGHSLSADWAGPRPERERKEEEALGTPPLHKQITACDNSRHTGNVHFTKQPG